MGFDCTSTFPKGTKQKDIEEFLCLLGYEVFNKKSEDGCSITEFSHYDEIDYRSITGIYARLSLDKSTCEISLWTRTTVWHSKFDSDFHNHTIKQLKLRFGGNFHSDYGKNRYFKFSGVAREKAEAGVYKAYSRFINNLKRVHLFVQFSDIKNNDKHPIHDGELFSFINELNPKITSTNIIVPYLVSAIEDFFRSAFISLLIYSDKKEKIIGNAKIRGTELIDIDKGILTVSEAIAKWMNFQDMSKINDAFKQLDSRIDVHGVLQKPFGRRKETFWCLFERLIEHRHSLIHRAQLKADYFPSNLENDVKLIEKAVWRVYTSFIDLYGWQDVQEYEF
jgi:hypothetical protein